MARSASIFAAALLLGACTTSNPSPVTSDLSAPTSSASTTAALLPSPSAARVPSSPIGATYPDGLPMTVNGEHAWRPAALLEPSTVPSGEFLVAAWDAGALATLCPAQIPGPTRFECPSFEGLADTRGGPFVISLNWEHVPIQHGSALVVRVTAEPIPPCVAIPSGGCPGQDLDAVSVVWVGDPG